MEKSQITAGRRTGEVHLVSVEKITLPAAGLERLRREAEAEGYNFLDTVLAEWASGENRFERRGEVLMGCFAASELIGIGGLTIDPYAGSSQVGRIRRVYICAGWRNRGVGRLLVLTLIGKARESFQSVRLRAENARAARLYERLGFEAIIDPDATHWMSWSTSVTSL